MAKHKVQKVYFSVIIATVNRANLLNKALSSLASQEISTKYFEIIVIDNGSKDETKMICNKFIGMNPELNITYDYFSRKGLSNARNRGVKISKGDYCAFLDDDALADKKWLENSKFYLENVLPKPIGIGGVIEPYYEGGKPVWFRDSYEWFYKGENDHFLKTEESFSGSNMIIRTDILRKHLFPEGIGMKGKTMAIGEETSVFDKIRRDNKLSYHLFYSSRVRVRHLVPRSKLSLGYRLKRQYISGVFAFRRKDKEKMKEMVSVFFYLLLSMLAVLIPVIKPFSIKTYLTDRLSPLFWCLGYLVSCLGISLDLSQPPIYEEQ